MLLPATYTHGHTKGTPSSVRSLSRGTLLAPGYNGWYRYRLAKTRDADGPQHISPRSCPGGGGGEWLEAAYSGGGGRRGEGWELRVNTVLKTWISKLFLEWRPRGWGG